MRFIHWVILIGWFCVCVSGCAAGRAFSTGEEFEREGKYEEAMLQYAEAFRCDPENSEYRVRFLTARDRAAADRSRRGMESLGQKDYASALVNFQTAYGLDPTQERYKQLAEKAGQKKDALQVYHDGEEFEKANKLKEAERAYLRAAELDPETSAYRDAGERVQRLLSGKPGGFELNIKSGKPFNFTLRNARVTDAFRILTQLSGINFLFDDGVKDQPVSINLEKTNFAQVLELLTTMNKLGSTVLNESTVLIYPRTPDKLKQYQELRIRTFHLNYLDAKNAVNLIRTMVPARKIHVNDAANSIVVRDTDQVIGVIEKLLDANDIPEPEVLLDVEVVELTDKNTQNVGLVLSRYAVDLGPFNLSSSTLLADSLTTDSSSTTTSAAIDSLVKTFSMSGYGGFVTVPHATYNFGKTLAKGEILSNPKIRIKNKEKAKFNIGTRVPITTTTTNGTSGGYSVNVQYVDVGVKVQAEPIIQLNNDIEIKLSLEVSSILSKEKLGDGTTSVVTIGTRNLETVLSIRDGETSVIGGLISKTNTSSKTKIFLLGDIPLIGPLLSGNDASKDKTELLLAITPRLVRGVTVPPRNLTYFMSGKEDDPTLGLFPDLQEQEPGSPVGVHGTGKGSNRTPAKGAASGSDARRAVSQAAAAPDAAPVSSAAGEGTPAVSQLPDAALPDDAGLPSGQDETGQR